MTRDLIRQIGETLFPINALSAGQLANLTDADMEWLEALRARITRTLVSWTEWSQEQADFNQWLRSALNLIEPHIVAGKSVPALEILLDARWGIVGTTEGPHRFRTDWPKIFGKKMLANPMHMPLVEALEGLPMEWLERVLDVALALIEIRHGPLTRHYSTASPKPDAHPQAANEARIIRKLALHRMARTKVASPSGEWGMFMGEKWPNGLDPKDPVDRTSVAYWKRELIDTAFRAGLPHPDDDHRIFGWLPDAPTPEPYEWWCAMRDAFLRKLKNHIDHPLRWQTIRRYRKGDQAG